MTWMQCTLAISAGATLAFSGALHCAGMCGPMCGWVSASAHPSERAKALLRFHLGRLMGYALAGVVVAGVGQSLFSILSIWSKNHGSRWVMLAWVIMGCVAIMKAVLHPMLKKGSTPKLVALGLKKKRQHLLGAATVFLPCGLLWMALASAVLTASWLSGGTLMATFAIVSGLSIHLSERWMAWVLARQHKQAATAVIAVALAAVLGTQVWMVLQPTHDKDVGCHCSH